MLKIIRPCLLGCVVAFALVANTHAGDALNKADAAFRRGDYVMAVNWYARAVQAESSPWAEYNLGVMYSKGLGVKQDMVMAAKWLQIAATHPEMHDRATALLSTFAPQQTSEGVPGLVPPKMAQASAPPGPLNDALAADKRGEYATELKLLEPLAEQGDAIAEFQIGWIYDSGRGEPQDFAKAIAWYLKAADQGYADAQVNLGVMYENGQGVPPDYAQATFWYRKAADQGNADARSRLANLISPPTPVPAARLTPSQETPVVAPVPSHIIENAIAADNTGDYATELKLLQPLADQGNANAQFAIGIMYENGRGVPQNYGQAAIWYGKAADQGLADAQANLGWAYANGWGVPRDYAQAVVWYRKAADQGNAFAQGALNLVGDLQTNEPVLPQPANPAAKVAAPPPTPTPATASSNVTEVALDDDGGTFLARLIHEGAWRVVADVA